MKPVLQALVLAERVYQDITGKKIIAGTFNGITIKKSSLPQSDQENVGAEPPVIEGGTDIGSPYAYISLTDVVGGTDIVLQFVNLSRNEILLEQTITLSSTDRLETLEIVAPLPPLRMFLHKEGHYAIEVLWNLEILGSHRILVREI